MDVETAYFNAAIDWKLYVDQREDYLVNDAPRKRVTEEIEQITRNKQIQAPITILKKAKFCDANC